MGFGRKADPEPGRCRRTDGKKWRCSKEAYPDSKYCEKHMHRGRNRSRKPVEISSSNSKLSNNQTILTSSTKNSSSSSSNSSSLTCETQSYHHHHHQAPPPVAASSSSSSYHESSIHPFLYPHHSSSSRPPSSDFSPNTDPQLFLYSGTHFQPHKHYRDMNGSREEVGVQSFFPSVADSTRSLGEVYNQPIGMMDPYKGFSQSVSQFYSSKQERQQQQDQQHCFVLGTDFNKSSKTEEQEEDAETQKPLLHFFEDCPPKNSDSWLDLASNSSIHTGNFIGL